MDNCRNSDECRMSTDYRNSDNCKKSDDYRKADEYRMLKEYRECCAQPKEWTIDCDQRVAYSYVPVQNSVMTNIYDSEMGLERGTIFPYLDIPLGVYGFQFSKKENMKL